VISFQFKRFFHSDFVFSGLLSPTRFVICSRYTSEIILHRVLFFFLGVSVSKFQVFYMASHFSTVVTKYKEELRKLHTIPRASYGNTIVGKEGFPNPLFFWFLFVDHARGIRFLQDCGLLKREMFCIKYESNMSFCRSARGIDEYRWKCCKGKRGQRWNSSKSLRYSSWFT
jgi:hypothetical protein